MLRAPTSTLLTYLFTYYIISKFLPLISGSHEYRGSPRGAQGADTPRGRGYQANLRQFVGLTSCCYAHVHCALNALEYTVPFPVERTRRKFSGKEAKPSPHLASFNSPNLKMTPR